jgi:acetyl-CoA carboxylase biotin carboxyl carrier protein
MGESDDSQSLLDPGVIQRLILQLSTSDVDELEIADGKSRLYLSREPGALSAGVASEGSGGASQLDGVPVPAPLTGVYYSRPSPDQPVFVAPGDVVVAGQVVALIETMKLFNEVTVEIGGEVLRLLNRDGDLVEAGQALLHIRPSAEGEAS